MGEERGMNVRPPVLVRDFQNPHPEVDLKRIKDLHPTVQLILVVLPRRGDYYRKYCTLLEKWPNYLRICPLHHSLRPSTKFTVHKRLQTYFHIARCELLYCKYIHSFILDGHILASMCMPYSPSGLSLSQLVMCSISAWSLDFQVILQTWTLKISDFNWKHMIWGAA